jgi:hypothetical protein
MFFVLASKERRRAAQDSQRTLVRNGRRFCYLVFDVMHFHVSAQSDCDWNANKAKRGAARRTATLWISYGSLSNLLNES